MRLKDSPAEAAWRAEVRAFLDSELPASIRTFEPDIANLLPGLEGPEVDGKPPIVAGGAGFQRESGDLGLWRHKLAARGWIAPDWPKEYGGAGLSPGEQFILNEEFARAGAPQFSGGMGEMMVGPTLIAHGTPEQKSEHLPKILSGETRWCEGFSEPGSGSDLASLQTRAVRDGDDYVINGQKIWTSGAQFSNWMFLLARTDPNAPKHRGISFFLMDFTSPGISLQPLVNMGNLAGFNQVFFDNVRVPARNLIGEENRGWYVGTTLLDFERSGIGSSVGVQQMVGNIIQWLRDNPDRTSLARSDAARHEVANRHIEAHVCRMLALRVIDMQIKGQIPNHEASMAKLYATELTQRVYDTAIRAVGLYGLAWDPASPHAARDAEFSRNYVQAVSSTIAGGTSEIQRNIIAQRGLGMPRG